MKQRHDRKINFKKSSPPINAKVRYIVRPPPPLYTHTYKQYNLIFPTGIIIVLKLFECEYFLSYDLSSFAFCPFDSPIKKNLNIMFCLFIFLWFLTFFIDFDGYYIVRSEEGHPRPKYIFNKCGTNVCLPYHHHRILNCGN